MAGSPPKKRRSARKQGLHRSHLVNELARRVNSRSPVKVVLGKKARKAS
jgi:hypothetical protein